MKTSYPYPSGRSTLPRFILDLLAAGKRAGDGVHIWLYSMARQLWPHRTRAEIIALLAQAVSDCGRAVPLSEIESAVDSARANAWQPGNAVLPVIPRRPTVNQEQREAIVRDGGTLADLADSSPERLDADTAHTEEIIDQLFPGNPLLCCGKYAKKPDGESYTSFNTKPRAAWRGELAALELIVPSPMSAITGLTKAGKESKHSLNNTGPRRFLICEFDTGTPDEHAAILIHLAGYAPLVCVVHSGGKSCHGWFYVRGESDAKVEKFFRYAVSLGADDATWTRSQFVRMPDGTRGNGKRQTVYFLNFKPLEVKP